MNNELETYERKQSRNNLKHYFGIFLEVLRIATRNLSQGIRFPCRDLNPETSE
jgi:hypothetical protein